MLRKFTFNKHAKATRPSNELLLPRLHITVISLEGNNIGSIRFLLLFFPEQHSMSNFYTNEQNSGYSEFRSSFYPTYIKGRYFSKFNKRFPISYFLDHNDDFWVYIGLSWLIQVFPVLSTSISFLTGTVIFITTCWGWWLLAREKRFTSPRRSYAPLPFNLLSVR